VDHLERPAVTRSATEAGKFVQFGGDNADEAVVPTAFGPFGVVVAGWSEDELEFAVGPTLDEAALPTEAVVPVRVLGESDLDKTLGDVLSTMQAMDAVMPQEGDDARLARPLLLFSGWQSEAMLGVVRKFRSLFALRRIAVEPLMAVAVPRAIRKPMRQLVEEIQGDFDANSPEGAGAAR